MSIGQDTKNYIRDIVNSALQAKIFTLLGPNGLDKIKTDAKVRVYKNIGADKLSAAQKKLKKRSKELYDERQDVDEEERQVSRLIAACIHGVSVDEIASGPYSAYNVNHNADGKLRKLVDATVIELLEAGTANQQRAADLMRAQDRLGLSIMMATSAPQIRDFVVKISERYDLGVVYDDVL